MNDEYPNRYAEPRDDRDPHEGDAYGDPPPPPYDSSAYEPDGPSADARSMAMLAHLLAIFVGFLGPLIIWLIKKDEEPFVDDQGKEALNFQISVLIASMGAGVTVCIGIGLILLPAIVIADIVFCIIAAIEANKGVAYRYPVNIRFIN